MNYSTMAHNNMPPFPPAPFYHTPAPSLVSGISDAHLAVASPVIAYWVVSGLFYLLDSSSVPWLNKYRIHESEEVKTRNRASKFEVLLAVIWQQFVQTLLGLYWVEEQKLITDDQHIQSMHTILTTIKWGLKTFFGESSATFLLEQRAPELAHWIYWWGIPIVQMVFAMFIIDTWQYFLHRFMHVNKFLYRHIHSVHHRLYVPYAFGALYNHPLEGFLLDSVGAVFAESLAHLSTRQTVLLFTISTMKTVDDHCGYSLPWDPLQWLSQNTADYHDIHHQVIGIKSNFSQPFFIHWDTILGTRMTRKDIEQRRAAAKKTT